jgi:tetraacyldisaccharide 4'-kinase
LAPASALYWAAVQARNAAYDSGAVESRRLPLPALGLGNLAVGGTGKTPAGVWLAAALGSRGVRPGILLRGYGGDEARVYGRALPEAVVVADPDRIAGAEQAALRGARALVLDDCLQRRDVVVDLLLAVVAAETWSPRRWLLPAGPWREGLAALRRADVVVVTHKVALAGEAAALAAQLAPLTRLGAGMALELRIAALAHLGGGEPVPVTFISGRRVLALCGVGEPRLFAAQLSALGAEVHLMAFGDHHAYSERDVREACSEAGEGGLVVTTWKDATKLEALWPPGGPPCLVAELEVRPSHGHAVASALLDATAEAAHSTPNPKTP